MILSVRTFSSLCSLSILFLSLFSLFTHSLNLSLSQPLSQTHSLALSAVGIMILNEVALGKSFEITRVRTCADVNMTCVDVDVLHLSPYLVSLSSLSLASLSRLSLIVSPSSSQDYLLKYFASAFHITQTHTLPTQTHTTPPHQDDPSLRVAPKGYDSVLAQVL